MHLMRLGHRLLLATVTAQLIVADGLGDDFTLAPGTARTVRASAIYRDIRLCNNAGSGGDLIAIVSGQDPLRLAPGECEWVKGDVLLLQNASTGTIAPSYKVSTCPEPR